MLLVHLGATLAIQGKGNVEHLVRSRSLLRLHVVAEVVDVAGPFGFLPILFEDLLHIFRTCLEQFDPEFRRDELWWRRA